MPSKGRLDGRGATIRVMILESLATAESPDQSICNDGNGLLSLDSGIRESMVGRVFLKASREKETRG